MALKLEQNPVFTVPVEIPTTTGKPEIVKISFRHKTKDAYLEWLKSLEGKPEVDGLFEIVDGWSEVAADFNKENLAKVLQNYQAAALAIYGTYGDALVHGRVKN